MAQVTGLEWNVRASAVRNADVLDKFAAVFDSYWQGNDFVPYDPDQFDTEATRSSRPATYVSHVGEKPMAITWQLAHPLPGDLFASFAAAVA